LDLHRYRPILRPISFVVRYYQFIHFNIISSSSGYEYWVATTHHGSVFLK
jgi:hypothetical protein